MVQPRPLCDRLHATWAAEMKHRKIRVNAISPGPIDTPGLRGFVSGLAPSERRDRAGQDEYYIQCAVRTDGNS